MKIFRKWTSFVFVVGKKYINFQRIVFIFADYPGLYKMRKLKRTYLFRENIFFPIYMQIIFRNFQLYLGYSYPKRTLVYKPNSNPYNNNLLSNLISKLNNLNSLWTIFFLYPNLVEIYTYWKKEKKTETNENGKISFFFIYSRTVYLEIFS